jgi:hypothetical protein
MARDDLLLSEEVLLLALDDESGRDSTWWGIDPALAGGILLDLARGEHLEDADGKLVPTGGPPPAAPLLADALAVVRASEKPRDARYWVGRLPGRLKPFKERVAERLVERGVLSVERRRLLGLIERTRLPEADAGATERALRERLHAVLLDGAEPDPRTALLVGLLRPNDMVHKVVPRNRRKEAGRRAKEIADAGVVGTAVKDAVQGVQTAVLAATLAASTAATTSGNGSS